MKEYKQRLPKMGLVLLMFALILMCPGASHAEEVSDIPDQSTLVWTEQNSVVVNENNDSQVNTELLSESSSAQLQSQSIQPMHRLYNPYTGEHFYTADANEKNNLVSLGWHSEGVGWYAPSTSSTPVYRLYNPYNGDHHYTMNKDENDYLDRIGWNAEGIGWYSDDSKSVTLYRQYNPYNAGAGSHNYTASKTENDHLASIGWNAEGEAWYGAEYKIEAFYTPKTIYAECFIPIYIRSNCETETFSFSFSGGVNVHVLSGNIADDVDHSNLNGKLIAVAFEEMGSYVMNVTSSNKTTAQFRLNIDRLYSEEEQKYIDNLIKQTTTSSMDSFEKMDAIESYLYPKMKYERSYSSKPLTKCTLLEDYCAPWWETFIGTSYTTPQYLCKIANRIGGFTEVKNMYGEYKYGTADWYTWHYWCRCTGVDKNGVTKTRNYQICPMSSTNVIAAKNASELPKVNFNDTSKFTALKKVG